MQYAYNDYEILKCIYEKDLATDIRSYFCPHCNEEVTAKKGSKRAHHFAHKANSNCTETAESILHFEAKHYLADQLSIHGNEIQFEFGLMEHIPMLELLNMEIGMSTSKKVSLNEIADFYDIKHVNIEESIAGSLYVADVLGETETKYPFAIEVYVTHEMEDEKKIFLYDHSFPFLEVIPYYDGYGQIKFNLHTYSLPGFFDNYNSKFEAAMVDNLYPIFETELNLKAQQEQMEVELLQNKLLAVKAFKKEVMTGSFYSNLIQGLDSVSKTTQMSAYRAAINRLEPLESVEYKKSNKGSFLIGRTATSSKPYFISSEQNLLYGMIQQFLSQIKISALIGGWEDSSRESIIGFELGIPEPSRLEEAIRLAVENKLEEYEYKFQNKIDSSKITF